VIPYVLDLILVATYPRFLDGNIQKFEWRRLKQNFREVFHALISTLRSRKVLKIIGSLSIYSGYYKAVKDYLQPVVAASAIAIPLMAGISEEQQSSLLVGLVFFFVYLLSSIASRSSGSISERFTSPSAPLNLTILIGLLCGVLSGFFFSYELWVFSVIFFIVVYMIENIRKPIGVAYLGDSINENVLASVLSVDSQLKSLTAAILAPLFGIFADLYGVGWSIMIISTALILITPMVKLKLRD
jgi:MFS family permease